MMLVTLQQANDHLRRDTSADDADLSLKIRAASGAVLRYLKVSTPPYESQRDEDGEIVRDADGNPVPELDDEGKPVVLAEVQDAVLLLVGYRYKNRDEDPNGAFQHGNLPVDVTALLYPLRDPTVA